MSDRRKILDLFEEQKDYVNEKVAYGIEQHRKGDAKLTVTLGINVTCPYCGTPIEK